MKYYNDQNPKHRYEENPDFKDMKKKPWDDPPPCRNCGYGFHDHYNGSCPKEEEE